MCSKFREIKNNIALENAEYAIDSRYSSKKEQEKEAQLLMKARLNRINNLNSDQILLARQMQLKLLSKKNEIL